ncbi:MAG: glycosyltransferase involved in cell wall biosynthesis [Myxococcota bacterium]|jgi:glycosyltransferase involved in cell wall biosynthesis
MSRQKHLVIDARMLHASGIGTYLQALLPRLPSRLPDVRFTLMMPEDKPSIPQYERVPLAAGVYSPTEQAALFRAIPSDADLVWSPHVNVPVVSRKRLLVTIHDAFYMDAEWSRTTRLDKRVYLAAMMRAITLRAAAVLTVSHFTADELVSKLHTLKAPVTVVHNGVDPVWLNPPAGESPCDRPYVVAVGNLKPHKNLHALVTAFARIADEVPHDLVLVGRAEGFAGGSGLAQAAIRRLGSRLRFTGHVPFDSLRSWVYHADLMAFVSLYEGFGLPPLEAMASGTPVLASRAASIPEVCGDAAAFCNARDPEDLASSLRDLLHDPERRAQLVAAGRERIKAFDWDRSADETAVVIRSLLL